MIRNFDEKLSITMIINSILFTILQQILDFIVCQIFLFRRGGEEKEGLFIHNPMCNIPGSYLCCQKIQFSSYKALYTVALFLVLQNL